MAKKWDIDVVQSQDDWYLTAKIGPFRSRDDAVELARKIAELGTKAETPFDKALRPFEAQDAQAQDSTQDVPPALGINVSETIATKDKFGG